jgi:hypothetical protein
MELVDRKLSSQPPVLFWFFALIALPSLLAHANYVLFFGASGQWLRSWLGLRGLGWEIHWFALFGPSAVLLVLWLRNRRKAWAFAFSAVLVCLAYQSWQPLVLSMLSALDLYPTHLEAFTNFALRDDWLSYD